MHASRQGAPVEAVAEHAHVHVNPAVVGLPRVLGPRGPVPVPDLRRAVRADELDPVEARAHVDGADVGLDGAARVVGAVEARQEREEVRDVDTAVAVRVRGGA